MWKTIIDALLKLFDLTRNVDRQAKRMTELENQVDELQRAFEHYTLAYQKDREREETEPKLLLIANGKFVFAAKARRTRT
jgi:hypothetical protein